LGGVTFGIALLLLPLSPAPPPRPHSVPTRARRSARPQVLLLVREARNLPRVRARSARDHKAHYRVDVACGERCGASTTPPCFP
jgi:hypothetical protein